MDVQLSDVRDYLNMTSAINDTELSGYLNAAVSMAENLVGPLTPQTRTEVHNGGGATIVTKRAPIITVTSLVERWAGMSHTLTDLAVDPAGYYGYAVNPDTGVITRQSSYGLVAFPPGSGNVTVTYTAGRSVTPPPVRLAVLVIVAHLWESQRGAAPLPMPGGMDQGPVMGSGTGYALPNRAKELLAPYRWASPS